MSGYNARSVLSRFRRDRRAMLGLCILLAEVLLVLLLPPLLGLEPNVTDRGGRVLGCALMGPLARYG